MRISGRGAIVSGLWLAAALPMSLRGQLPYELRDTASWSNMMYGGSRAVLYIDGAPVDTVDLLRGVQVVPGGIVYQPVGDQGLRNVECGAQGVCVDLKPWVLRARSGVVPLAGAVPGLDSILSSPLVLDGDLYGSPQSSVAAERAA